MFDIQDCRACRSSWVDVEYHPVVEDKKTHYVITRSCRNCGYETTHARKTKPKYKERQCFG